MSLYYGLYYIHLVVGTCASIIVTLLNFRMLDLARQKRLLQFLRWLRPATVSTLITTTAYLSSDAVILFGYSRSMIFLSLTVFMSLCAIVPTMISMVRLYRMLLEMLPTNIDNAMPDRYQEDALGDWPPRPKRPTE